MGEVRVTSASGGQKGQKDQRLGGADPLAMQELGCVYGMGEEKYTRFNYLRGYAFSLSIDALKRHLLAFEAGEDRDPESGLLHTAHVAWHGLALTSFILRDLAQAHPEFDDRAPRYPADEPPTPEPAAYVQFRALCEHKRSKQYTTLAGRLVCGVCFLQVPVQP